MIELHTAPSMYEREIHYNEDKEQKIYLMVNTFKGKEYLHIRKYYQDFDEQWKPSKEGVAMELDLDNSRELFTALVEILSLAESKKVIEENFKDLLDNIYQN
jgi:hypothetical protein|tara:strand:- start:444 stop:749 length:306 start_codon:yes stop_codon:yes gene_type:complete